MQRVINAFSTKKIQEDIIQDIFSQLDKAEANPKLIIFTAQDNVFAFFAKQLQQKYPDAVTIGSTSYIHTGPSGISKSGASVMAIYSGIEVSSGLIFEINKHPMNYHQHVRKALNELSSCDNTCCLEFSTAFSLGEEIVLDTFQSALEGKNITVFGSTAGAKSFNPEITLVALNGDVYVNTCVFCFIHNLEGRIFYYSENIFKPTGKQFIASDVDCENRIVYSYNDRPAAIAISEASGVPVNELKDFLNVHPMGRMIGDKMFLTDMKHIEEDFGIAYHSRIYNRTKVFLMEVDDVEKIWEHSNVVIKNQIEKPSFVIMANCMGRSDIFEKTKMMDKFAETLTNNYGSFISVSGFGEQLDTEHFNRTMIFAVFE